MHQHAADDILSIYHLQHAAIGTALYSRTTFSVTVDHHVAALTISLIWKADQEVLLRLSSGPDVGVALTNAEHVGPVRTG